MRQCDALALRLNDRVTRNTGFGPDDLRALAGPRSFERGRGYLDAVTAMEVGDGWITATVHGTTAYAVELSLGGPDGLGGECDCPYGVEGNFCKHLVALGLTVLAREDTLPQQRDRARTRTQQLDVWLAGLSKDELLDLVREQITENLQVRRRLELRAASARGDLTEVRTRIHELLDISPFAQYGYVEYTDARAYGEQAAQAVSALTALTSTGRAADAVSLSREAIRLLGEVQDGTDDSDGHLHNVGSALAEAHLDACRAARPDPTETARWLVGQVLNDLDDLTGLDPLDYAEVLGEQGMVTVRQLAVEAWHGNRTGWAEKYLMERLARAGDDVDTVVAVHAAALAPDGSTHLIIARELDAAGRRDESLRWAERGIREASGPDAPGIALVDYLCDRYTLAARPSDAVVLRRDALAAHRSLTAYQQLRTVAQAAGCWQAERERALALLRADAQQWQQSWRGGPALIDALLDDGDIATAWQAAAETGAHNRQWLALADQARTSRPSDALDVYLRLAEPLTKQTGNTVYEQLASLLLSIRDCHRRLGTEADFMSYLTALRAAHKRKRNLMRLIDQHGL
ncbi:SWIM zinc finger domain-containing protein [Streptomyces sp. NPDC048644]|uniref:SWIM zinc finger family protein n=1 Tax=Streptomyces sp. NPDC048644 TaxID=3365582 RepID=UPI0037130B57